jgi:hypothetical protein
MSQICKHTCGLSGIVLPSYIVLHVLQQPALMVYFQTFSSVRHGVATMLQGRKKNASATGVTVAGVASAASAAQLQAAKKTDPSHTDFYRFQQREQRRNGGC